MAAALRRAMANHLFHVDPSTPAYGLRRFLQKRPAFQPAIPPDRLVPFADGIRGLGATLIRLDGLAPPPAPPEVATAAASLTVEEARKVLRATQMEAARARLRASGSTCVPYAEFLRVCRDAAGPESGAAVARALDESGSVIVLGSAVFLRPEMEKKGRCSKTIVVKAIEKAMPQSLPLSEDDPAREELKVMEAEKADIDRTASTEVRRELWCGLAFLLVQTAGFMRLTFWELSWDVMEPICFYVTSMYFMGGYTFFLRTKKEPSFEGFFESRFVTKQRRLMRNRNFDLHRYNELRKACGLPATQAQSPCAHSQDVHCHLYCHCH